MTRTKIIFIALLLLLPVMFTQEAYARRAIPPDQALIRAAMGGDIAKAKQALERGANPNAQLGRTRVLIHAVMSQKIEMVKLLLRVGADVNSRDAHGKTALKFAQEIKFKDAVELLRSAGGKTAVGERKTSARKDSGLSPEGQAVLDKFRKRTEKRKAETPEQSDIQKAFSYAILRGNIKKMKRLIKQGANVNDHSKGNYLSSAGRINVLKFLIDAGADVNYQEKNSGHTALISFAGRNPPGDYTDVAKALLEAGADVNLQDIHGTTALMAATSVDQFGLVKLLIQSGADLDIQDHQGATALIHSIGYSHSAAELLVQAGADQSIRTYGKKKETALDIATRLKFDRFIEILSHGAAKEVVQETSGPNSSAQRRTNNSSQASHAENKSVSGSRTSKRNDKRTKEMPVEPSLIEGVLKGALQSIF